MFIAKCLLEWLIETYSHLYTVDYDSRLLIITLAGPECDIYVMERGRDINISIYAGSGHGRFSLCHNRKPHSDNKELRYFKQTLNLDLGDPDFFDNLRSIIDTAPTNIS